jgi:polyisoprenyl-phosphate glycosyltransferase
VKYMPIDYLSRKGKSKIKPFRDGANFILLIVRAMTFFNPLKIFLPASLAMLLAGLSWMAYQVMFFSNISDLSVILILVAIQIGLLGLIADVLSKKL